MPKVFKRPLVGVAGVLAATIAVVQELRHRGDGFDGLAQGVADQLRGQRRAHAQPTTLRLNRSMTTAR